MFNWKWWNNHQPEPEEVVADVMNNAAYGKETATPLTPFEYDLSVFNPSEPVTSFIKCFKDNPRRFTMTETTTTRILCHGRKTYRFKDKVANETWAITIRPADYQSYPEITNTTWMTKDELTALTILIGQYYNDRHDKLSKYRADKIQRRKDKERDRLTQIYKQDDKQC